nr:YciI family protein [Cutibacterium namnetense]
MLCMAVFIVETHYDPAHAEERMAARPAHLENLDRMRERGQLLNAGPLADGSGAVLIYTVPDRGVLERLIEADPYPKTAVQVASVREWEPNYHHHVC